MVFPGGLVVKNPCAKEGDAGDAGSTPPSQKTPWSSAWKSIPILFPGKFMNREDWWTAVHADAKSWI